MYATAPECFMSQTMHQPLPNVYTSACLDHPLLILQPSYKSNVCDSPRAFYESDIRCWEKPDTAPCKANEYFLGITEERFGTSWKWKSERKLQCGAIFAAALQLIPRKKQEARSQRLWTRNCDFSLSSESFDSGWSEHCLDKLDQIGTSWNKLGANKVWVLNPWVEVQAVGTSKHCQRHNEPMVWMLLFQ